MFEYGWTKILNFDLPTANVKLPTKIFTIEVRKQDGNIDILCIVNGETAIIIEDKTGTKRTLISLLNTKNHVFNNLS